LGTRPPLILGKALFFANPDSHHEESQLPSSEKEVAAGWHALKAGPEPFVGTDATKAMLFEHIASARMLHLACHYVYDPEMPMLSFLKLAEDLGSEFVYCFELDDIEFSTELITLSACESGLSKTETGDEQYGMVRTLLGSGARSVLSTLWKIEDNSAAQLFAGFYPAAREVGLAQALAWAQRRLLRHPYYSLPNFWAPYVLSGEWKKPLSSLRFG
jgi:CHAT domain-containing protein